MKHTETNSKLQMDFIEVYKRGNLESMECYETFLQSLLEESVNSRSVGRVENHGGKSLREDRSVEMKEIDWDSVSFDMPLQDVFRIRHSITVVGLSLLRVM